ncbi:MAG: ATP-binding cassette domain-containing protein [Trueperaceae bacterium]|nr:ATP-binding cassette domain-containing protein [Trueperaceae bacterium]
MRARTGGGRGSQPASNSMVEFRHVTKTYPRTHTHALKDVDFHIAKGEFVYVTGHSGAGKSTLLALMLRRIVPTEGTVAVAGNDVSRLPESRLPYLRRSIGMIFQDHRLLGHLSALENLTFALRAVGARGNHEQRAMTALRQVGLAHKRKAFPIELSLGEQQRVAAARALVTDAPLLLADEPTGNLDPDTALEIMELLDDINLRGTTILLATHARDLVDSYKRRTLVLRNGELVRDDARGGYSL